MSRCKGCGVKLDARNERGFCRACFNALPLAHRLPARTLLEVIRAAPQSLVAAALEEHGYQVTPPGGAEV